MKVYQIHYHHPEEGRILAWYGSRREAKRALGEALRRLRSTGGIERWTIPTDRRGFLMWLNSHFTRDWRSSRG